MSRYDTLKSDIVMGQFSPGSRIKSPVTFALEIGPGRV